MSERREIVIDMDDEHERRILWNILKPMRGQVKFVLTPAQRRSAAQNRLYWGVYIAEWRNHLAKQQCPRSETYLHESLKDKFLKRTKFDESGQPIGEEVGSTGELSPSEFNEYLKWVENYLLEEYGIVLPSLEHAEAQ